MEKPKKEMVVLNASEIKEVLGEDPLVVSGLKYDKEKYEKKIDLLKEMANSDKIGANDKKRAQAAMQIYQMAVNLEVPASGITILGGNPYINTAGLLYKTFEVAKNYGGIKSITSVPKQVSDCLETPAFFIGRIEFKDGTVFEDFGEASVSNIKMSTIRPFLNSMAARRATNRAMRLATGIGLVSAEEIEGESKRNEETTEEKLLTEKEFKQIADTIADLESCGTLEELEEKADKISLEGLSEFQIATIKKVIANKGNEMSK